MGPSTGDTFVKAGSKHVPSIPQLLYHRAEYSLELPAIIGEGQVLTYPTLKEKALQLANALFRKGIQPHQRVAVYAHNSLEMVVLMYALWIMEIQVVPLSTRFPARVIPRYLADLKIEHLIAQQALATGEIARQVVILEELWEDAQSESVPLAERTWEEENPPITVVLTSGTSGTPKAAVHRWSQHYFSARGSNENLPFKAGERWLLSLPLYHIGGIAILFRALLGGAAVVIGDPGKITVDRILQDNITHVSMVATQLQRFVDALKKTHVRLPLKAILLGGGPIPPPLIEEAYNLNLPLFTSYGSTEMCSQITATEPGAPLQHLLTAGKPLPFREVKISPDDEILVRGYTLFDGYWKHGRVEPQQDTDGWFHTGDVGKWTVDGYLKIVGRKDNMFVSGGENIHPEEIELCLLRHPDVQQAVVVDIPDHQYGARPVAFVKVKHAGSVDPDVFRKYLEGFLPRFKIPDHFFVMPESETRKLKPSRKKLREIALEWVRP